MISQHDSQSLSKNGIPKKTIPLILMPLCEEKIKSGGYALCVDTNGPLHLEIEFLAAAAPPVQISAKEITLTLREYAPSALTMLKNSGIIQSTKQEGAFQFYELF